MVKKIKELDEILIENEKIIWISQSEKPLLSSPHTFDFIFISCYLIFMTIVFYYFFTILKLFTLFSYYIVLFGLIILELMSFKDYIIHIKKNMRPEYILTNKRIILRNYEDAIFSRINIKKIKIYNFIDFYKNKFICLRYEKIDEFKAVPRGKLWDITFYSLTPSGNLLSVIKFKRIKNFKVLERCLKSVSFN
ncbi:MAG: hypothetical protein ACTSQS_18505, partial [Promethearchaeota archaeon]